MSVEALHFPSHRADIGVSLRDLADRIDAGDYETVRFAVCGLLAEGDKLTVFAWGKCSDLEAAGALSWMAQQAVSALREGNAEADDPSPDAA